MQQIFNRPDLDEEDKAKIPKWVNQIVCTKGRETSIRIMTGLIVENIRLTKEVNLHREKLGYERLPIYEPKI